MLEEFDISWASLPASAKQLWLKGADARAFDSWGRFLGREVESWYTWSRIFKKIWNKQIFNHKLSTADWFNRWKFPIGRDPIWTYPDMKVESSDFADLETVMEAWSAMKQKAYFEEFARRWKDDGERQGLWNEITEHYGVGELFPQPPSGPPDWLIMGPPGDEYPVL